MWPFLKMKTHFASNLDCKECDEKYGSLDLKTILHELTHRLEFLELLEINRDDSAKTALKAELERHKTYIRFLEGRIEFYKRNAGV